MALTNLQQLMTRAEFQTFINKAQTKLYVRPPYSIVPCKCGDLNCHGWRFVEVRPHLAPVVAHELAAAGATEPTLNRREA